MTERAKLSAKRRYQREAEELCPNCKGTGRVFSQTAKAKATQGGNAAYLKSLEPGQLSMSERGKKGGAPRLPTIDDLMRLDEQRTLGKIKRWFEA